jgi:alpha-glucosidase (family GH31 glycosyl hydrolase)
VAYSNGESMMQFESKADYSYKLGSDIFVTPFLAEGTSITVNFPAGSRWVYLYDEARIYNGGSSEVLQVPLDEFPVFFKEGCDLINSIDYSLIQ